MGKMSVITVDKITKHFGSKQALGGVSIKVKKGEIFGFLGPNGAGKSTTIRCLMDFIRPNSGEIKILGLDAQKDSAELKSRIGFLSSDQQLYSDWTGFEHLQLVEQVRGKDSGIAKMASNMELDLNKRVKALSSGNKQKLGIVLAFAGNPDLLIMDEPTRGLDPLLQNELYELLRQFAKKGGSVFFSSHNLPEVQRVCDAVAVIRTGSVVAEKTMSDIRNLHIHLIEVVGAQAIPPAALQLVGVEVLHHKGREARLKVRGDLNPILKVLTRHNLVDIEVSHASLEDVFMEFYQ
jgi:ABC-2 type transport system ATP-binding protein